MDYVSLLGLQENRARARPHGSGYSKAEAAKRVGTSIRADARSRHAGPRTGASRTLYHDRATDRRASSSYGTFREAVRTEPNGGGRGIRHALPQLDQQGVTLALENNEAFSAPEFAGLMRRIASPRVGICLDTANSLGRPETLKTVVEHLAEYAVVLHAKDYDIRRIDTRLGFSVVGQPAGDGQVDFEWVLAELRERGRDQISVIVEHWPPFEGTIDATVRMEEEWLARSVRFLRSWLSDAIEENVG